ncbi:MAG TPA: DUF2194 domain-containing protein, partial [Spirochaetia bacterium]|nr:DUF2194 domain-containing protein [Spirochaetia bacterium]
SISTTEFYTRQWWPDIKDFFKRYDIPFTSYLIFNYNQDVRAPYTEGEFYVADDTVTVTTAREILSTTGRLGFHGYNHVSPTVHKTKMNKVAWPSLAAIKEGWTVARQTWIRLFGEYSLPFSYVAPNNVIQDEAIEILHEVFPSIKVVSSLRATADDETVHEFGPHPTIPDLYFIPRQTSGYVFTSFVRYLIASSISGSGIWSHFIHADDLFDPYRSEGKTWDQLKGDFHKMISFVKQQYPWIRFVDIREAYQTLRWIDATGIEFNWDEERTTLRVESTEPGLLVRIRTNAMSLRELDGAELVHRYSRMPVVIVRLTKPVHRFVFRPDR